MRLLIIDDDRAILNAYVRVLDGRGWTVRAALGGQAGIQAMMDHAFDAVRCDVQMPAADGRQVYEAAKRLGYSDHIVFWSGAWNLTAAFAAELDSDGVPRVAKPALDGEVIVAIQRVAADRHAQQEALHEG